jgi:purine-binding chemotaxis protein CheW
LRAPDCKSFLVLFFRKERLATLAMTEILSFTVNGERLALPAADVSEIIRPRAATRVPHAAASMIGVVNLRGTVLPVLSTAGLLDRAAAAPSPAARVVVVQRNAAAGGARVGLLVDSVAALRPLAGERVLELDALLARDFGGIGHAATHQAARQAASQAARQAAPAEAATRRADRDELALVGFGLGGQDYALKLADIEEIAALPPDIAALPHTDAAMIGVVSWRGALLPVVSLRVLLGMPMALDRSHARMIVTRVGGRRVGLAVDAMRAILRVPRADIDTVPPVLTRGRGEAQIEAIARLEGGKRLVSILVPSRLFDEETAARIAELGEGEGGGERMASMAGTAETQHGALHQFVVFQLGAEHYGLPIAAVDEVVRRPERMTRVPRAPAFLEGVMNLRGRAVPVINQRQRFALPEAQVSDERLPGDHGGGRSLVRIVILTIDGLQAGFVVDAVSEVLSVANNELQATPTLATPTLAAPALATPGLAAPAAAPEHAYGDAQLFDRVATIERDGRMILLVNPKALLDRTERDMLAALSAAAEAGTAHAS